MEIALCHLLLLTPCSIIFYLFRVFASSVQVCPPSPSPPQEALGLWGAPPPAPDWGGGGGREVPLGACPSAPGMPLLSNTLERAARILVKDLVFGGKGGGGELLPFATKIRAFCGYKTSRNKVLLALQQRGFLCLGWMGGWGDVKGNWAKNLTCSPAPHTDSTGSLLCYS